jgi:plasmid stabilization system protein ParE
VTRLVLARRLAADFARIERHLVTSGAADVEARLLELVNAIELLRQHPQIGRKVDQGHRELVIGRGSRGYLALYVYDPTRDVVTVAALRSQREQGYAMK